MVLMLEIKYYVLRIVVLCCKFPRGLHWKKMEEREAKDEFGGLN